MTYDLIVIGTGVASSVASKCRKEGWSVAIVDSRPFGGTCSQRGCDPKKILVDAARALHHVRRMNGHGIDPAGAAINWHDLMKFKQSYVEDIPEKTEEKYREEGIDAFHGPARFVGEQRIEVDGEELTGRHILVATGAKPMPLDIEGVELMTTSDAFMELKELPKKVIFVGGGYISFEFAHLVAQLEGVDVTILNEDDKPLAGFDPDLVDLLINTSRKGGIRIELEAQVRKVSKEGGTLRVEVGEGESQRIFEADLVVHGAGRVPAIDDLNLEAAGIASEKKGISVNDYLQSVSNPAIYAAGDCAAAGGLPLTPVASRQAKIVAHNLLNSDRKKFIPSAIPSVAFTIPSIASVGLHQEEVEEKGIDCEVTYKETTDWYSARHVNEGCSGFKTIVDKKEGKILGAHLVGPYADEVINLFALAIRSGLDVETFEDVMYAYPTGGSDSTAMLP